MNQAPGARGPSARLVFAFVAAAAFARLAAVFLTGFYDDEAYTIVIARRLALSYFDHPPLHQWILHGAVSLVGETRAARLPFFALLVATNWPLFAMARRLFDREAALWTLVAFNAAPYFLVMPDGYILPDTPMLFLLALAGWGAAEILFGPPRGAGALALIWLGVGAALGLAGLAKYSAIFAPFGLALFLVFSPRHRHWLIDARPWLAAGFALAIFSPALIWNAEHHWVSFAFQSGRAAESIAFGGRAFVAIGEAWLAQLISIGPWVAPFALCGLWGAARQGGPGRLSLALAAPPLLLFSALPLLGQRAIPHWFNSGWLFAFPLAGHWIAACSGRARRRYFLTAIFLAASTIALYLPVVVLGPARLVPSLAGRVNDPTRFAYDWASPAMSAPWRSGGRAPDSAVVQHWRIGGRVGVALGPDTPICAFTPDPRGFAFACDQKALIGKDALMVTQGAAGALAPNFEAIGPTEILAVGRGGSVERELTLTRGVRLTRPFPLPYGE